MIEGQLPSSRKREDLTHVGVTGGAEQLMIVGGDGGVPLTETGHVIDFMRQGVAEREEDASPGAQGALPPQLHLRTVVIGSRNVLKLTEIAEGFAAIWRIVDPGVRTEGERVHVHQGGKPMRGIAKVTQFEHHIRGKLLLYGEIVLKDVGRAEVGIDKVDATAAKGDVTGGCEIEILVLRF